MLSFLDDLRGVSSEAVLLKIALAFVFGLLIGMERSAKNRPAGFRTHILVCIGAAIAATTGLYITLELQLPSDISRISAQVISGLGFIGAGTIIVTKSMSIKGLTTAAGLWTTGIIGLAIGSGYYELGFLGTVFVLLAETLFATLGKRIPHQPDYCIEILYNDKQSLDQVLRSCKDNRMTIVNLHIHSHKEEDAATYAAEVHLRGHVKPDQMVDDVRRMRGVISAVCL